MPRLKYEKATGLCRAIQIIVSKGLFPYIDISQIYCLRSYGSRSRAIARIYGLPRPWIIAGLKPGYVIEVVSERFYRLDCEEKVKTLLHELLHIPKTFSGALRPHGRYVNGRIVNRLYRRLGDIREICRVIDE